MVACGEGGAFRVGVLENIRRGWDVFSRFIRFEVMNDLWCGDQPLRQLFQSCLALLSVRRLRWQNICNLLTILFNGISLFPEQCMIGGGVGLFVL
jgi:hypothetical protein